MKEEGRENRNIFKNSRFGKERNIGMFKVADKVGTKGTAAVAEKMSKFEQISPSALGQ